MSTGQTCTTNNDCSYLYSCVDMGKSVLQCQHDDLFAPSPEVVIAFILLPILIGIGNVGGLGGGITKVPIMMILLNYNQKIATNQAYCIQFGACISNAFLLFQQRHPNKNRPLIDYNLGLILVPIVLLGTTMGILVNANAPEIAPNSLFILFLFSIMPYLFKKSRTLAKKEQEQKAKNEHKSIKQSLIQGDNENQSQLSENDGYIGSQPTNQGTTQMSDNNDKNRDSDSSLEDQKNSINSTGGKLLLNNDGDDSFQYSQQSDNQVQQTQINPKLQKLYNVEAKYFPPLKTLMIVGSFLICQFINFSIGSKGVSSIFGFEKCGSGYWVFSAMMPIVIGLISYASWIILSKEEKIKQKYNYDYDKEDFPLSKKNFGKMLGAGFCAGFLAGALGAGGGLSLVTFLMALGLNSRVASATTGLNNLFIGLTSLISVLVEKTLNTEEILTFIGASLVGGLVFSKIIYYFVAKYNKNSLVVMFVFVLCIINVLGNVGYIVKTVEEDGNWDGLLNVDPFCPTKK